MAKGSVISAVLTLKDKDFTTNATKATKALEDTQRKSLNAKRELKGFGKSATSGFKSVASGALKIAGAVGIVKGLSAAFNMVKSSIGTAFERIDTMEQFDRTMTSLTGSSEKAADALDATNEAVKGTAFGLDTAAKGVQDFVTRGMDVEKATGTMEAFGDAVAFYGDGSNEQLSSVSDALAKMYSKGKVSMDQMNRLYDAGIDGVGIYAQATGKGTEEVQKALSDGTIDTEKFLDVVSEAMMEGTNGVENISGAAKEAGASWGASFDNMKAAVARGVTSVIQNIDEMLEENGLPDMRGMVAMLGEKFEDVLGYAASKVPDVTDFLVGMYEKAEPGISWIKDEGLPKIRDALESATDKAKDIYDFFSDNWPLIEPIIAGVTAGILAYKAGVVAVTAATAIWKGVTSAATIASTLLNGVLAISPLGWVAIAIGAVVAAGIALYKNWDVVKEKAQLLWDVVKAVGRGIKNAFVNSFNRVKSAAADSINFVLDKINSVIETVNKVPGVNIPVVPKVDFGAANSAVAQSKNVQSGNAMPQYASGTNRVPSDMIAKIHKDEMIVPARQSKNLRDQGVTIDNIDRSKQSTNMSINNSKTSKENIININVDARDKTVSEIANELVPILQMRIANL